jgi:ubiquinone/menaquinone biosynthesis C-methylase UbiE
MNKSEEIKQIVKTKYAEIATQSSQSGCCAPNAGTSCCDASNEVDYSVFNDSYTDLKGYIKEADLGLGCGIPTEYAGIKEGDTVVDLGSGAGNDVFVAGNIVGDSGKVIGIDMTEAMVTKANQNLIKLGFKNIEFKLSEIENILLNNDIADVVISNCVLNLVPNKKKAFEEIHRILKPGAHFCISDIVLKGELPENIREAAEMYAGCVSGAEQEEDYLNIIRETGFTDVVIKKSKKIELSDELLSEYLNTEELKSYRESGTGIFSITVVGTK